MIVKDQNGVVWLPSGAVAARSAYEDLRRLNRSLPAYADLREWDSREQAAIDVD